MSKMGNVVRLLAALVLCAAASVAVVSGGPAPFRLLAVGIFVLAAPGLVLMSVMGIRDPLLSFVIAMIAGPSGWVLLATFATFTGYWWPGPTVVTVAAVLAAIAVVVLLRTLRRTDPLDEAQHRFAAHPADEVVLKVVGQHRGAFPSPYSGAHDRI